MKKYLKRFKRKIKYNRKANNIFLFIFVMFLFMGVGYAYLNATLSITGTGKVTKTTWDVHFENIQPISGSVTPTSAPAISNDTTVSFSATLNEPGDFYSFDIDLVNAGTIDATIGSLDITPVLTSEQQEYFEYKIKYKGDSSLDVSEGDALSHGDTKTIEILFRYKELDNHDLYPDEDVTFNFSITINAIQTTYDKEGSVLKSTTESDRSAFRSDTYRNSIRTITLDDHINPPSGYIESWDVSEEQNGNVMAYIVTNSEINSMYDLYIQGNGHLYAPEDSSYLFYDFKEVEEFNNLFIIDTSNVTTMERMFQSFAYYSFDFRLDLSNWNTSNVTSFEGMFYEFGYQTTSLSINLSNWNTSNATTMEKMFYYTGNNDMFLNLVGLNDFDTSSVTNMSEMFYEIGGMAVELDFDFSSWNTSNVTNFSKMFGSVGYLANSIRIDLSNWNTSNAVNIQDMFYSFGKNATLLSVIIPRTNGNGLNNTTTRLYGNSASNYAEAGGKLNFTLAST